MRHPSRQAIDKFNMLLNLHEETYMQDWEIECADPSRVDEFLVCYKKFAETEDERFTLMALILGSYEEYHSQKSPKPSAWMEIRNILVSEKAIHKDHIEYYSCLETKVKEEWFPITSLIRGIPL